MAKNILLTSLSAAKENPAMRYFAFPNEFGFEYCDAILETEAGIKAVLSRYDIDEVLVIGGAGSYGKDDAIESVLLTDGRKLYNSDRTSLSTYGLLQYRLAQYADDPGSDNRIEAPEQDMEARKKLKSFIEDYFGKNDSLVSSKLNRLFDELSQNGEACVKFLTELYEAFPELWDDQDSYNQWVAGFLYSELKSKMKLELLPINEKVTMSLIADKVLAGNDGQWLDNVMSVEESIAKDYDEINLYIFLGSADAADTFIFMNMLDIMVTMPDSRIRLKKLFTLHSLPKQLCRTIRDDTEEFGVTDLFHGIRAFVNYGKSDMIVDLWKKSREPNENIAAMIYAMRHVDVGLSMCNISEVESGILRLRQLFKSRKLWREFGYYGVLFSVIAERIREDYGTLLEGDGDIPFIELVKWAYRHQFYQQTLTLIESKAPENLVRTGIFYYCNSEDDIDKVAELFAEKRLELKPYEYFKIDDINHYFIKTYDRAGTKSMGGRGEDQQKLYAALRTRSVENEDPTYITGYTNCDSNDTLQDILFAYYHVGEVRNKISHADEKAMADKRLVASESDDIPALTWLKESIDFFIRSYEKAVSQVQGKQCDVVTISGDYVKMTAEKKRFRR